MKHSSIHEQMSSNLAAVVLDECFRTELLRCVSHAVLLDVIREHLQAHTACDDVYLLLESLCDEPSSTTPSGMLFVSL